MRHFQLAWLRNTLRHAWQTFDELTRASPQLRMLATLLILWASWHVYVPIHELTHAGAALATGGTVTEIALEPQYGGTLLARWFPFVVSKPGYAGQLSGFEVPNDLAYFFVDAAPYLFSVPGVAIIEQARRRQSLTLFGVGFLLSCAPFISIQGDYYEAASLLTNRVASWSNPGLPPQVLVHDNVGMLWSELQEAGQLTLTLRLWIGAGLGLAVSGAIMTLYASHQFATRVYGQGWLLRALEEQRAARRATRATS